MSLEPGTIAPDFTLPDAQGKAHRLSEYRGKHVVIYFYPKDDTPGCTKEACSFRYLAPDYSAAKAVVLGISPDDAADHQAFIGKYKLPFTLLSDPDKSVMIPYGAWGEKVPYGKTSTGTIRSTVLVGPDGRVIKHWKKVPDAEAHPAQVLKVLAGG